MDIITALKPLLGLTSQLLPPAKRVLSERSAGQTVVVDADLLRRELNATLDRLGAIQSHEAWWRDVLTRLGHAFVTPDFLAIPSIQEWLRDAAVRADLVTLAADVLLPSSSEAPDSANNRLAQSYSDHTGEAPVLAQGPIDVIVAIMLAGYFSALQSGGNQQALAGLVQGANVRHEARLSDVSDRLDALGSRLEESLNQQQVAIATTVVEAMGKRFGQLEADQQVALDAALETRNLMQQLVEGIGVVRGIATITIADEGGSAADPRISGRLDAGAALFDADAFPAARLVLESAHIEDGTVGANLLRFRLHTLLGACALEEDDTRGALDHLRLARDAQPDRAQGWTNFGVASLQSEEPDAAADALAAAREALQRSPNDPAGVSLLLEARERLQGAIGVRTTLEEYPWAREDRSTAGAMAHVMYAAGQLEEAESHARRYLENHGDDPRGRVMLATILLTRVEKTAETDPPATPAGLRGREPLLLEAESMFSEAIGAFERRKARDELFAALLNRSSVRGMRRDFNAALEDSDAALAIRRDDPVLLRNRGMVLLNLMRWREAYECLSRVPPGPDRDASATLLAMAALRTGRPSEAMDAALPAWRARNTGPAGAVLADMLIEAATAVGDDAVIAEVRRSVDSQVDDPDSIILRAKLLAQDGKSGEGARLLEAAIELASGNTRQRLIYNLALTLNGAGDYLRAAALLRHFIDEDEASLRLYIQALRRAGEDRELLNTIQEFRMRGQMPLVLLQQEQRILLRIGDLAGARRVLLELYELDPTPRALIEAAQAAWRSDDEGLARSLLANVTVGQIESSAELMRDVALLRAVLGEPGALELAFRARQVSPLEPASHARYVEVYRITQPEGQATPDTAGPGTAVDLEEGGRVTTYFLLPEGVPRVGPRDLLPDEALAQLLRGRCLGDEVLLRVLAGVPVKGTVRRIRSVEAAAYEAAVSSFAGDFPTSGELPLPRDIPIGSRRPPMRATAPAVGEIDVVAEYRAGRVTLAQLASGLGRSTLHAWMEQTSTESEVLMASPADGRRTRPPGQPLAESTLVFDSTTLAAVTSLQLEDALAAFGRARVAPQQVRDELLSALAEAGADQERAFLKRMLDFLRAHVEVVPVYRLLDVPTEVQNGLSGRVGVIGRAVILCAQEHSGVVVAEDQGLRQVAGTFGLGTGWSADLLNELRKHTTLDDAAHDTAMIELIRRRYNHVPLTAQLILRVIGRSETSTAPDLQAALAHLGSEWIAPAAALSVIAQVGLDLYERESNEIRRQQIVYAALNALAHRTGARPAGEALLEVVQASRAAPEAARTALELDVTDWVQRQPILR